MGWLETIFRTLLFWLDSIVYKFIPTVYNLLVNIAETSIFSEDVFTLFSNRIYTLLGVFMLFKVSFSILTYIVDPDAFTDKNKGFGKLISNIIITLVLLILTPFIFTYAMELQGIILKDNLIGKLFSTNGVNTTVVADPGNTMAYETFKAFYYFDVDRYKFNFYEEGDPGYTSQCVKAVASNINFDCVKSIEGIDDDSLERLKKNLTYSHHTSSINIYMDVGIAIMRDSNDDYVMTYTSVFSTLTGVVMILLLIVFCFDIAVRSVKLGFLRMLAPVPIISRIDPKKGKEVFDKWVKTCMSTYFDLFIRLLAIYFAIFVITQIIDLRFTDAVTGQEIGQINPFVKVFIILGALLFAKQLPKLISDLTGVKMDGKFTLNPLKKMSEVPGIEKIGGTAGGTVAGIRAGSRVGNPLLGAAMGFASGYKSSSWAGNGKGGFMAGANGTYKKLMGKDFLNIQFKPGGKSAVQQIKDPLNKAYDIKNQLEKSLNMVAHQSSQLASNLVNHGVDVNGDLGAQSAVAQSNVANLKKDINDKTNQIADLKSKMSGIKSKGKLLEMNKQLANLETELNNSKNKLEINNSVIKDIENYQQFSNQEASIRTALSKVQKDIDDLSKEKSQRQSFYGVDPSPADDVKKTVADINEKGINKYFE